jgi:hypothetical protein
LFLEQLAHQRRRRPSVAPTLNQYVENLALVIDTDAGMIELMVPVGDLADQFRVIWRHKGREP